MITGVALASSRYFGLTGLLNGGTTYCPTILLPYCPVVLLSYCPTALLSSSLSYCPTVLLSYCPTFLLSYCPTVVGSDILDRDVVRCHGGW